MSLDSNFLQKINNNLDLGLVIKGNNQRTIQGFCIEIIDKLYKLTFTQKKPTKINSKSTLLLFFFFLSNGKSLKQSASIWLQ